MRTFIPRLALILLGAVHAHAASELVPIPTGPVAGALAVITDCADDTAPAFDGAPAWSVSAEGRTTRGWLVAGENALHLRVETTGRAHKNTFAGKNLWRGDCIYLSFDGLGDTPAGTRAYRQPDDALILVGLGSAGPEALIIDHGRLDLRDRDISTAIRAITQPTPDTTRYELALPWEILTTVRGGSAALGVAHVAAFGGVKPDLTVGRLRGGADGPRELIPLALPAPTTRNATRFIDIATLVAFPTEQARIRVVTTSDKPETLTATLGEKTTRHALPGEGWRVFELTVPAADISPENFTIHFTLSDQTSARHSAELTTPAVRLAEMSARLAALAANAPHPLLREHCESTAALVRDAFERLAYQAGDARLATEFMQFTQVILSRLPMERYDWEHHVAHGLPLLLRFLSPADQSLQFYTLQVPVDRPLDALAPLTVYLHGVGSANPLSDVRHAYDPTQQDTLFDYELVPRDPVPAVHTGFVLAPWGRGNRGYQDVGHEDVLAAIEDVQRRFHLDPTRCYLTGFSMGAGGTWRLASRTPDRWAGVGVAAMPRSLNSFYSRESYLENLRHTPLDLWVGELDRFAPNSAEINRLRSDGRSAATRHTVVPQTPHTYPYAHFKQNVAWLMAQPPLAMPAEFTFTMDHALHPGRNGVEFVLSHDQGSVVERSADAELPRFTARLSAGRLELTTTRPDLPMKIDPARLGFTEALRVIRDGAVVHDGPFTGSISLP